METENIYENSKITTKIKLVELEEFINEAKKHYGLQNEFKVYQLHLMCFCRLPNTHMQILFFLQNIFY